MSRVLTFSRVFPSYHPRAGEPTQFVEKIWKGLSRIERRDGEYSIYDKFPKYYPGLEQWKFPIEWRSSWKDLQPKYHTIRAGHRWKAGDWFSPRVWSGKPYASKQIAIAPDIQIKKTWDFKITEDGLFNIDGNLYAYSSSMEALDKLANNDGLDQGDFLNWFPRSFNGQILSWNDKIEY